MNNRSETGHIQLYHYNSSYKDRSQLTGRLRVSTEEASSYTSEQEHLSFAEVTVN